MKRYWPVFVIAGLLLVVTPLGGIVDKLISGVFLDFVVLGKIPLVGWQISFGPVFIVVITFGFFYTIRQISRFTDKKVVPLVDKRLSKQLASKRA